MLSIAAPRKTEMYKQQRGERLGMGMVMPWKILAMVGFFFLSYFLGGWIFSRAGKGKPSWFLGKEVRKVGKLVKRELEKLIGFIYRL